MRKFIVIAALAVLAVALAACGTDSKSSAANSDARASNAILEQYQKSQPVPRWTWSQLRQNLIEIRGAQAETTRTTSFFFNQGVPDPVSVCPSIGFPIPSTSQLTAEDFMASYSGNPYTLPQIEPNGVYSGDSSGTYVVCLGDDGKAYIDYWEGFVKTVSGPAEWDREAKTIRLTGTSTAKVTVAK